MGFRAKVADRMQGFVADQKGEDFRHGRDFVCETAKGIAHAAHFLASGRSARTPVSSMPPRSGSLPGGGSFRDKVAAKAEQVHRTMKLAEQDGVEAHGRVGMALNGGAAITGLVKAGAHAVHFLATARSASPAGSPVARTPTLPGKTSGGD